nr:MAG TPA: hypothetical protein [Caudoviricetes sp.]
MAIRWKNTGTDRKKKQTVPGGATVQIGDIRQGAELPVEKPSYQLMGAQQPAAAQRASAQAAQTNGQRAAVQSSAPSTQSSGRQVGYDPGGNQAYQEALRRMQETEQTRPEYQDSYSQRLKDLYDKIMGREKFQYDAANDPLYQQYRQMYVQQGRQAMADTMGQAAGLTGGYGSTYSQAAGQQQYDAYLQKLNEVVPELYAQARQAYNDEGDRMLQQYQLTGDLRDDEYSRYQDQLSNWWKDLSYQADRADTEYSRGAENWWNAESAGRQDREFAYQQKKDAYSNLVTLIGATGYSPSQQELEAAGMSAAEAAKWQEYYRQQQAEAAAAARYSSSGGSGSGGRSSARKSSGGRSYAGYPGSGGNRVYVPGYGDISYEDAERLEQQGYIVLQGTDSSGKPIYARSTKKNINKPTRMTV